MLNESIFTRFKKISYGRSILVAILCCDSPFYSSHRISVDLSEQDGQQEQARQQVLVAVPSALKHECLRLLRVGNR